MIGRFVHITVEDDLPTGVRFCVRRTIDAVNIESCPLPSQLLYHEYQLAEHEMNKTIEKYRKAGPEPGKLP